MEQLGYDLVVRDRGSDAASKVSKALKSVDEQADKVAAASSKLAKSQIDVRQAMVQAGRSTDQLTQARSKLTQVTLDANATDKAKAKAARDVEQAEVRHARAMLGVQDATEAAARASRDADRAMQSTGTSAERSAGKVRSLSNGFGLFRRAASDVDSAGQAMGRTEGRSKSLRASLTLLSGTGRGLKAALGVGVTGVTAIGLALAGVGVAAIGLGVKTASGLEQAQIGFTTMLGSAKAAKSFLAGLQKFAAATPFEFPELVTASQKLLAMGIHAKDVVPYMRAIGDAVAGLGGGPELIDQVTTAIGQMSAKGKIQSDELLQLTEAGIPALKILAASYGVSASKMQDMITKGKILSDDALPRLIKGLETGTATTQGFGGMMAKQSQSMAGLWSTLQDNVSMSLANMITPAIPMIKQGLAQLSALTATEGPKLTAWVKTTAIPQLQQMGTWLVEHKVDIQNFFVGALIGALKFGAGMARLAAVVIFLTIGIIGAVSKMESAILTGVATFIRAIGQAGSMIPGFKDKMDRAAGAVEGYRDKANASAKAATDQGSKMLAAANKAATGMSNAAAKAEGLKGAVQRIPGSHSTIITTPGVESAAQKMGAAQRAANSIPSRRDVDITVHTNAPSTIATIERQLASLHNRTVTINVIRATRTTAVNGGFNNDTGFAKGTPSAPPGLAWTGERGPELVDFRGGERVVPHAASVALARKYAAGSPGWSDLTRPKPAGARSLGTVTLAWPDGRTLATLLLEEERRGGPISVRKAGAL